MINDKEIREAFQELRAADQADVPDFGGVMAKQHAPATINAWRLGAVAMGAAAAIGGIAIAISSTSRPTAPSQIVVPAEVVSLSNWKPMTDALLSGPYAMPLQDEPLDTPKLPDTFSDTSSN